MLNRLFVAAMVVLAPALPAGASCSGADPSISAASLKSVSGGSVNSVHVSITVKNVGAKGQPSNTLQSVAIYQNETKVGMKGIPPLTAGQSYTFVYTFSRSNEAAKGSTPLRLQLAVTQPAGMDCDASNDVYHLRV